MSDSDIILRILMVEDVPQDTELAEYALRKAGFEFTSIRVDTKSAYIAALESFQPGLIISDYSMPQFDGLTALKIALEKRQEVPFILLTGAMNEEVAVDCMKAGAWDYVLKNNLNRLPFAVNEVLKLKDSRRAKAEADAALRESEARLKEAQKLSKIGDWEWNLEKQTLTWSDEIYRIFGVEPGAFQPSAAAFEATIHPEDKEDFLRQRKQMLEEKQSACIDHRIILPDGEIRFVQERAQLLTNSERQIVKVVGTVQDITDSKRAEEQKSAHLRFLGSMDRVNRVINRSNELNQMMNDTLGTVLSIFDSDRVWLFYPCDPESPFFRVPKEVTKPEYPGAGIINIDIPMPKDMSADLREALESPHPLTYCIGTSKPVNKSSAEQFGVKSMMMVAIYPKVGKPWVLGMHQCSHSRVWTTEDQRLFQEIARRLTDGLTGLLSYNNLLESEHRLNEAQRLARIGSWDWDALTDTINWSQEYYKIYGFDPSQPPPGYLEHLKAYTPESAARLDDAVKRNMETGEPYEVDLELMDKSGQTRWITARSETKYDASGRIIGLRGTAQDITNTKLAENEIRESEEKYRLITENAGEAILITQDGMIKFANSMSCKITGYTLDELYHFPFLKFIHPNDRELVAEMHRKRISGVDVPKHYEFRLVPKDGETLWVDITVALTEWEGSIATLAMLTDITLLKQVEEAVRIAAQEWQTTFDATSSMIWLIDSDHQILRSNKATEQIVGMLRDKVVGKHCWEIVHDTNEPIADCPVVRAKKSLRRESMDLQKGDKWFEVVVDPILDKNGQYKGAVHIVSDITERKRMEEAIRASEEKYRAMFENAGDYVLILEIDDNNVPIIIDSNQLALDYHGYTREELIGKPIFIIDPFTTREQNQWILEQLQKNRQTVFNVKHRRKDGTTFFVETRLQVVNLGEKEVILSVERDITERMEAQEALRESETRFDQVAKASREMIWEVNAQGLYTHVSDIVEDILGYKVNEIVGIKHFYDLHPKEGREEFKMAAFEVFARKGKFENLENLSQAKDGRIVVLATNGVPIIDDEGNLLGYRGADSDITEKKRAEEALRESELTYRGLFENSRDGIMTLEPPDWAFTSGNRATIMMFGVKDEDEFTSYAPWQLSPIRQPDGQDSIKKAKEMIELALMNGTNFFEWTHKRLNGEEFPADVLLTRIEKSGRQFLQATVRDISERKSLEAQFLQSQKMESVGRLAGGVAHDFNNMLSAIMGNAEIALMDVDPSSPIYWNIKEIISAAEKSADITRQLLTFARKQIVNPQIVDPNSLVESLTKMLRRMVGEAIDFEYKPCSNIWRLKIDPSQVDQILMNLTVNARDAIDGHGKITVSTDNVAISETTDSVSKEIPPGEYVMFELKDTGKGMSNEVLEHIFEPFFTTKDLGKGTGLGLSIVFGIVQQNEGYIIVESEVDLGTTFKVLFPRDTSLSVNRSAGRSSVETFRGTETILLVEDEVTVLNLAKTILEQLGYRIITASNGVEAIKEFDKLKGQIDLLVTDIMMPQMHGTQLFQELIKKAPKIKALFMSGYTSDLEELLTVSELGMKFLQKPFTRAALAEAVRGAIDA